jgi:hypothetical protein
MVFSLKFDRGLSSWREGRATPAQGPLFSRSHDFYMIERRPGKIMRHEPHQARHGVDAGAATPPSDYGSAKLRLQ